MDTHAAIAKVLENFTQELLKIFSASVVEAVAQVGAASRGALPSGEGPPAPARKRGRPPKLAAKTVSTPAPAKGRKGGKAAKAAVRSSPEEVARLGERIVVLLAKSSKNLAAKEIMAGLNLSAVEEGRFQYALGKLKDEGLVVQHGDRRSARYGAGKGKAKRGPGRPRKTAPTETHAIESEEVVPSLAAED